MTQHEYIFVTVSIIIGLSLTRLLHVVGDLIRYHEKVKFHWSTAIWGGTVMIFTLQLWWVGWDLHDFYDWSFIHFLVLILASIFMYGAAEMALPDPDDGYFDMLSHSRGLGRVSAMSLLLFFILGPYFNIVMFNNPILLSLVIPLIGAVIMLLVIFIPRWFKWLSVIFGVYSLFVLFVTV